MNSTDEYCVGHIFTYFFRKSRQLKVISVLFGTFSRREQPSANGGVVTSAARGSPASSLWRSRRTALS